MTTRPDDATTLRWRIAAMLGPEIVALALVVLVAFGVAIVVWSGSSSAPDRRAPARSPNPGPSRSDDVDRPHLAYMQTDWPERPS